MYKKSFLPLLSFVFLFSVSCQVSKSPGSQEGGLTEIPDSLQVNDSIDSADYSFQNRNLGYQAEETKLFDLIHTRLEVKFDWENQYLNGIATLELMPHFYPQSELVLDAKGFDVHQVLLMDSVGSDSVEYSYDGEFLTVFLNRSYTRDETVHLKINYTAKPNEYQSGGSEAITSDKGLYFINPDGSDPNLPRQIWTQGETEASSKWFPTIDAPNQRTTQEMYITVDENFTTLSNGVLIYSQLNEDGTRTDYWKMEDSHAPYLFMMAIGEYAIVKERWEDMEVSYYVEPEYEQYAKAIFGNTPEMLSVFSEMLDYKYPWSKYSQVVVRNFVSGAMENTTASTFMEALQVTDRELLDKHWDGIIAHELFHHWFGDLVTNESWANLPLNEAFANYSEYLWNEYKYGVDEADFYGLEEVESYLNEAESKKVDLIRYYYDDPEDMFDSHSYAKGGRILHMLRKYVGDEAFFASLSFYLKQHEFSDVEVHDLRLAFEEVTGEDLNWFFNQWFMAAGHPELEVSQTYQDGVLDLNVKQVQDFSNTPVYTLPLYVDIYNGEERERFAVVVDEVYENFKFEVPSKPSLVIFDAEGQLLGEINFEKSIQELAAQYRLSTQFLSRYNAISQLSQNLQDATAREIVFSALDDAFWGLRQEALAAFHKYEGPEKERIIAKVREMGRNDSKSLVRADALALLATTGSEEHNNLFLEALDDPSYAVIGSAIYGLAQSNAEAVRDVIKEYETNNNINIIIPIADYYAMHGNENDLEWFKKKLNKIRGGDLYYLLQYFGQYLMKMPLEVQREGVELLHPIATDDDTFYIRLAAFQGLLLLEDVPGVTEKIETIKKEEQDERLREIYSNY